MSSSIYDFQIHNPINFLYGCLKVLKCVTCIHNILNIKVNLSGEDHGNNDGTSTEKVFKTIAELVIQRKC